MSPKPSIRDRTRTHEPSLRSPSMASTLRSPSTKASFDSLQKPQLFPKHRLHTQTQAHPRTHHRTHRSSRSYSVSSPHKSTGISPSASFPHKSGIASSTFSSTTTLTSNLLPSHISTYTSFSSHPTKSQTFALEFLNFLDDLGVLVLFKPVLELCSVEWATLFDELGIFYFCEPVGALRKALRKLKLGRADKSRGARIRTSDYEYDGRSRSDDGYAIEESRRSSRRRRATSFRSSLSSSFVKEKVID